MGEAVTSPPGARARDGPTGAGDRRSWSLAILPALRQASIVIDHQRYYYLDDDQMISMRYARNLVDGMGLVWNAGIESRATRTSAGSS